MAITDESGGFVTTMPVAPATGNSFGGFGGDWGWIILLLLFAGGGWGNGFGGFGGGFGGYEFPWLLNGQQNINANTNNGFRDAMLNDGINSVRDGINGLQTQICGGFGDVQMSLANGFAGIEQGANARQMANMQTDFAMQNAINQGFNGVQSQLAQCCCDNRLATQDVKYTIANEACTTRAANAQNTQSILDKLCQLELDGYKQQLDAKNDIIAQLRQENLYSRGQASQVAQTAELRQSGATQLNQLVSELRSCPIPAQPVYGSQPIFTCGGGCGCGA